METLGTVREHVGGYMGERLEKLSQEKENIERQLLNEGTHFRDSIMKIVGEGMKEEKKRLEENNKKLSQVMDTEKIHAFHGKNVDGNKRIVGMHDHGQERSAIDTHMLQEAIESGNMDKITHIKNHEDTHEKFPGPNIYQSDPEILQKTLIGLYEGWTEERNLSELKNPVLEAYTDERKLLKDTVGRAGNAEHLKNALEKRDVQSARIILLHSLKYTRPDLLGNYNPTLEFMRYKKEHADKRNIA